MDIEYIKICYSHKAISPGVSQNVELLALSNIKPTVLLLEKNSDLLDAGLTQSKTDSV